jgi:hypothetical protein
MVPRVLICTPEDLQERLRSTLLWRAEVERLAATDADVIMDLIRERRPRLLIIDGRTEAALSLIQRIRSDDAIRDISIAGLTDGAVEGREAELRKSGANVVLSEWQSTPLWDDAFQELLNVPPRRWMTFAVTLSVGARYTPEAEQAEVTARNISVRGLLVETDHPLPTGTVVNLFFPLSEPPPLHLVGRIVWAKAASGETVRQGIEFLGFHGDALGRIAAFVGRGSATPSPDEPTSQP